MMRLLNKKINLEKEIGKTTKIFGEKYDIKIIYKKIENPELNLNGKSIEIMDCFYILDYYKHQLILDYYLMMWI